MDQWQQEELANVTNSLLQAASAIAQEYMMLPVANREDPTYRERVYCYE